MHRKKGRWNFQFLKILNKNTTRLVASPTACGPMRRTKYYSVSSTKKHPKNTTTLILISTCQVVHYRSDYLFRFRFLTSTFPRLTLLTLPSTDRTMIFFSFPAPATWGKHTLFAVLFIFGKLSPKKDRLHTEMKTRLPSSPSCLADPEWQRRSGEAGGRRAWPPVPPPAGSAASCLHHSAFTGPKLQTYGWIWPLKMKEKTKYPLKNYFTGAATSLRCRLVGNI